ncbi:MAG: aminotransferase class I/II-fold pyridoxal phosphate-dependent enzyme [Sedimentisphaerales bacterium]|nr:aminotransferase class I/II-fold pyridoxal phosphate-dependent enzyme [Sedimentisphaerales bacterium]
MPAFFIYTFVSDGYDYPPMKNTLADRMKYIDSSGIRRVFALAATMKNPVDFSIGQPDFDVPQEIKRQAIEAIEQGFNRYSQTAGIDELIGKVAGGVRTECGWQKPNVLITSGVSGGLLLAFLAMINPGDEVIIPDPYFVIYKHLINMLGGCCVFVDCYPDFALPVEKIIDAITDKTKLIIINSPCNPTGMVYGRGELEAIAQAADKRGIVILSDEIYRLFSYDGPSESIARYYDKTLLLRGFGKTYGVTGWRLGYAAAGEGLAELIEQMVKIQQYTFVCAPTPFQKAASAALDYDATKFVKAYKKKRDLIYDGLKDKFEIARPGGAFYAFVKAPAGAATEFVAKAIANNVLVIPGNVFSEKDTHFRISYATSDEKIRQGVEILCKIV